MAIDDCILSRRTLLKSGTALAASTAFGGLPRAFAADAPKPEKLTMLYATSEADSDAIKAALPAFKEAFGIDIALDTMPYNALQQKAFAELASESPYYDIMIVDTPWMPALTNKILPITALNVDPAAGDGGASATTAPCISRTTRPSIPPRSRLAVSTSTACRCSRMS